VFFKPALRQHMHLYIPPSNPQATWCVASSIPKKLLGSQASAARNLASVFSAAC